MWRTPLPLVASAQPDIQLVIDADVLIGDLHTYLGSPTQVVSVEITADGCDVGNIIISTAFAVGSTFEFIATNSARYLGLGGIGGNGGADFGTTGEAGDGGQSGGHAITNQGTYAVSINVDNGFIFGGGGGGGGGSYDNDSGGLAGSGGGGGQGYNGGAGGLAGTESGIGYASNGSAGSRLAPGDGGINILSPTSISGGGDGGGFGYGGATGRSSNLLQGPGFAGNFFYFGGLGGNAGRAYSGSNLTLSGTDTEADLRTAGRILGEIGPNYLTVPSFSLNVSAGDIQPTNDSLGVTFQSSGSIINVNTTTTPVASTQYYLTGGTGTGSNYQVRTRALAGDGDQQPDTAPGAAGTWFTISSAQSFYWTYTGSGSDAVLFELRRADSGAGPDEVMASFYVKTSMESEP